MGEEARANGWRGFDGIGEKVEGGWEYRCDGIPSMFGCPASRTITRRWTRVGPKKDGWVVVYGLEEKDGNPNTRFDDPDGWVDDEDVVLVFCPTCATAVQGQKAAVKSLGE